jgi:hypothetical protein
MRPDAAQDICKRPLELLPWSPDPQTASSKESTAEERPQQDAAIAILKVGRSFGAGQLGYPKNGRIVVPAPPQHCARSIGCKKSRHKTVAYTPVLRRRYNILAFKQR